MSNWFEIKMKADKHAEIYIYDQIGKDFWGDGSAVEAKKFIKDVKALGEIDSIDLRINSPGGSVFEGNAIYNFLMGLKAKKTVYIDGLAASMASVIAMVGDEIIMPENAIMMIHNPIGLVYGNSKEMLKTVEMLDKLKEGGVSAYEAKTSMDREEISKMMDEETWMTAEEAVDLGFATKKIKPVKAAASYNPEILKQFKHVPLALMVETKTEPVNVELINKEPEQMNKETLLKDHPELAAELKAEGYAEGLQVGKEEGAKMENERIKSFDQKLPAGYEDIIQEMKFDGKSTPENAALAILAAENIAKVAAVKAMSEESTTPVEQTPDGEEEGETDPQTDAELEMAYKKSSKLQQQFSDVDSYKAFTKAQANGQVKILKK